MYAKCFEFDPCLWRHGDVGFRWSAGKDVMGTIKIVPLEDDWIEYEFAAGKQPPYNPVEEFVETFFGEPEVGLSVIPPHWTPASPGTTPPWKITFPNLPPWRECCIVITPGNPPKTDTPDQPAAVWLGDAGFYLASALIFGWVFKKLFSFSGEYESLQAQCCMDPDKVKRHA